MDRKFTAEEKQQLIANLDIEVEHRIRQFESYLTDALQTFILHAESHISRIPRLVRDVTMREFGEKYGGDVQACLRGLQHSRMQVEGVEEIGKEERKRKWVQSQEEHEAESSKTAKNARIAVATPKKKPGPSMGPGTATRMRMMLPRAASPTKAVHRPPSSSTFKPVIPKTPAYPSRMPRKDESMLSLNGSPLLNPLAWLSKDGEDKGKGSDARTLKRSSSIVIQRDPSSSSLQDEPTPPPPSSSAPPPSAQINLPTLDGHLLTFDAFTTSPGELDALEGISEAAKQTAREEMRRLVVDMMGKWGLGEVS